MIIDETFLITKFTEVTLLHIFLLLAIPYIIFYLFERLTKFDKFAEKWEVALFVFVTGGSVTLFSIFLQQVFHLSFWIFYSIIMINVFLALLLCGLSQFKKRGNPKKAKWVLLKLKNGVRFKGRLISQTFQFITLGRDNKNKISRLNKNDNEKELNWTEIHFNISEILGIYILNPHH